MNKIFYGIRRLLLLNTASYALGDFPLDRPLSISAPNNRGKSTAINALQFPFLSHLNDMSFPRSNDDTRRYYFPYDNSYVVSEVITETGTFVIGASGKGQASGYEYQLFVYQDKLDVGDYLVASDEDEDNRKVRNLKELGAHLAMRGIFLKSLQPKQMRDALMGKTVTLQNNEKFTIGVFRLRSMTDDNFRLFIRVFKNLLHMNNVNLEEMKRLLIDVLLPGQGSNEVDFMARYMILREEVDKAKNRADTAVNIAPDVKRLSAAKSDSDDAHGIMRHLSPRISAGYERERERRMKEIDDIQGEIDSIEPTSQSITASLGPLQERIQTLAVKKEKFINALSSIYDGEVRFALYTDVASIEGRITIMQAEVEKLVGELQRTNQANIGSIKSDLRAIDQEIKTLESRIGAINNNLLFVLSEAFGERQLEIITKLLNSDLLSSLPIGEEGVSINDTGKLVDSFKQSLSHCKDGFYDDGNVRIDLAKIPSMPTVDYFDFDSLTDTLARRRDRKVQLERDLEVASDYASMEKKKNDLLKEIQSEQSALEAYRTYLEKIPLKPSIELDLSKVVNELEEASAAQQDMLRASYELGMRKTSLNANKLSLESSLRELQEKRKKMVDIPSDAPLGNPPRHQLLTALVDMIDAVLSAQEARQRAEADVTQLLTLIEQKGGSRFITGQGTDKSIQELVEAVEGAAEYIKQHENCEKAGLQEIGALLKGLADRFDTFEHEVNLFNRQMNSKTISNIRRIDFVIDSSNKILKAVRDIVSQDTIFSDPDKVHRAVRELHDLVTREGVRLSLESMFNLGIKVELENGKVTSSFNDANIQSTGTGLTIKVVLNVMLLSKLLYSKEGQSINIPIYIDEAGQIDPANQQTLIDQCMSAGFVPVFASVEAQAAADYWIGLSEVNGRIYVDQNDWFRLSQRSDAATEVLSV